MKIPVSGPTSGQSQKTDGGYERNVEGMTRRQDGGQMTVDFEVWDMERETRKGHTNGLLSGRIFIPMYGKFERIDALISLPK